MSEETETTEQVPAGRYQAKAIAESATFGTASTGTKQVGVSYEIIAGSQKGRVLPWYGYFTDDSKARTIDALMLSGCEFADGDVTNVSGLGTREVSITVECKEHPESGELVSRVAWVNQAGGIAMKDVMDEKAKANFAKSIKGEILAAKKRISAGKNSSEKTA